ncbi:MAG TPA: HDIG domain-containing protein [Saprospiraceae bacterium]|nr:HDIG domain-containing protein [Saprospiraceae bacterium]HMQ84082.1 HDIG domain-containing protein [Saprospiraceae bacterium]
MNKFQQIKSQLSGIASYGLFLGAIVLITNLFPNKLQFNYNFDKGKIWPYSDLRASFDFAVLRPQQEIIQEEVRIKEQFSPYYEINDSLTKEQLQIFREHFKEHWKAVRGNGSFDDVSQRPEIYETYGEQFLKRILKKGILKLADNHNDKTSEFVIHILDGNTVHPQTLGNLQTLGAARNLLIDSLPYSGLADADFLYPILEKSLAANLFFNPDLSEKMMQEEIRQISQYRGKVAKGEIIVPQNGLISDEVYQRLESYRLEYEKQAENGQSPLGLLLGYLLLASIILGVYYIYLKNYYPQILYQTHQLFFLLMWVILFAYLVTLFEQANSLNILMLPYCIVPIVIKNFFDSRLAFFTHIVVVLIAGFISSLGYEFIFLQVLAGMVVIVGDVVTKNWNRFFYSILFILLTYVLGNLGIGLVQGGDWADLNYGAYYCLLISSFLTLLAYPLIPLFERFFRFTSSITLTELQDHDRPLLRELAAKAPGTWQHSIQVGNMAEEAARAIQADALLIKVAALYHDIGKSKQPEYYIENQAGENPHLLLSEKESAKLVISHVEEGVKMAKKAYLPVAIIEFIKTHHGTTRAEYFYRKYKEKHPNELFDDNVFRYPGPKPKTKEQTILMLADTIEAGCKSLKNPTETELITFIDKLISEKIAKEQLQESVLSFEELELCREVFHRFMKSVHHGRIEYPKED